MDFLETRDVKEQLIDTAGQRFSASLFLCNSMILQLRVKAMRQKIEIVEPAFSSYSMQHKTARRPPSALMDCFWDHARQEALSSRRILYLFPLLNHVAPQLLEENHYYGWLADESVDQGVPKYLFSQVETKIRVGRDKGHPLAIYPLEIALVYMKSTKRLRVIDALLKLGADPNKAYEDGTTVWERYLMANVVFLFPRRADDKEREVIEQLVQNGADLRILQDDKYIDEHLTRIQKVTGTYYNNEFGNSGREQFQYFRQPLLKTCRKLTPTHSQLLDS